MLFKEAMRQLFQSISDWTSCHSSNDFFHSVWFSYLNTPPRHFATRCWYQDWASELQKPTLRLLPLRLASFGNRETCSVNRPRPSPLIPDLPTSSTLSTLYTQQIESIWSSVSTYTQLEAFDSIPAPYTRVMPNDEMRDVARESSLS